MKQLALILAFTLAFQDNAFAFPPSDAAQASPQVNKVKTEIQKYATAKKKQVKVTVRNGNQLKGYISRSDDLSFDLTEKSGRVSKLRYADPAEVHGAGLNRGAKIASVVGCAVAVVAVVLAIGVERARYF